MSEPFDRRVFLRRSAITMAALGVVSSPAFLAACSSDSGTDKKASASGGTKKSIESITVPFLADMQVPDPDIFYEAEGNQVILACYDSLVRYAPVAKDIPLTFEAVDKRIEPWLAESYEISEDRLTYTFHLKANVKFHDGTVMDAESWRKGFDRRLAVNQGPAYMITPVASTAAPDPLTFVVTLKHPIDAYLDYLACPYSPKAVSPAAVEANAVDGDLAQKWLTTHSAGTGPYKITEFIPSDHYTLEYHDGYWGEEPEVKKVTIMIMPDVQTQELKFKSGDLDMIIKGLPIQDVEAFKKDSNYVVERFQTALTTAFFMNASKGRIFENQELREAVKNSLDRAQLTKTVYKDEFTPATEFFPEGCFPDGLLTDAVKTPDVAALKKVVSGLSNKKVDITYGEDGGATNRLMGQLLQTHLQAAGLDATVRGIPTSIEFSLAETPDDKRPDIMLDLYGGDTTHIDTMLRIVFRTGAVPLNWFNNSFPEADTLMDQASEALDPKMSQDLYQQSAEIIRKASVMVNISNQHDIIVARAGISNIVHDPMALQSIRFEQLKSA